GFKYGDLYAYVPAHRGELVQAGLTILRAHEVAGRPTMGVRSLGSFEPWSQRIACAIVWAGGANTIDAVAEKAGPGDPTKDALRVLLEQFWLLDGSRTGITAREIVGKLFPVPGPLAPEL